MKKKKFKMNTFQRCKLLRKKVLEISQKVQAIHIGGSFSMVEILDTIYFQTKKKTDRVIVSKGHAAIIQYVILNMVGNMPNKILNSYTKEDGLLGVHPEIHLPGIECSTGSLGHGLGFANGLAYANKNKNVYVVMSDGELMEGSVWEAALLSSSLNLNNLIVIIDNNNLQSATRASETHPTLYPIKEKFKDFGWDAVECDGHDTKKLKANILKNHIKPKVIIAKTIKGYPISYMMDNPIWHYRSPNKEEYKLAIREINEK